MRTRSTPAFAAGAVGLLAFTAAIASAGCSGQGPATCNPCDTAVEDAGPPALNPDGIPYPDPPGGYGRRARSLKTPGSVIQDFKFQGYRNADQSTGLQTISLADYYDPCGKRLKLLHLTVAGVWCVPCNEETDALVAGKATTDSEGVVVIQALSDGAVEGVPATLSDLDTWISKHKTNFTEMLDPGLANLGGFFMASAIPWNCDIDPRTMEILDDSTGWAGDIVTELQPGLTAVASASRYPIPAACGDD